MKLKVSIIEFFVSIFEINIQYILGKSDDECKLLEKDAPNLPSDGKKLVENTNKEPSNDAEPKVTPVAIKSKHF